MVLDGANKQFDNIESQETTGDILSDSERINNINENFGDLSENFDVFENFISKIENSDLKEKILSLFETQDDILLFKLEDYIDENGFPTDITKDIFFSNFNLTTLEQKEEERKQEEEETKQEEEETKQKEEETKQKANMLDNLVNPLREKYNENLPLELATLFEKYEELKEIDLIDDQYGKKFDEINDYLSKDIVNKIANYILTQPGVNLNSNEYIEFKRAIIAFKPESEFYFESFEKQYHIDNPTPLDMSMKNTILSEEDMGEYDSLVDFDEYPPIRSISLEDSEYKFSNTLPILNFKEPIAKFERAKMKFEESKAELNKKGESIQSSGLELNADLQKNREKLKSMEGSNSPEDEVERDFLESQISEGEQKLEDFKKEYNNIKEEYGKVVEEYKDAIAVYKQELADNEALYRKNLEEKDKEKTEILDFLKRSGFDLFPQDLTNQLITELKQNALNIPGFDIDYGNINLEKGRFGQGPTEKDSTKWKENMIMFMNKAIYGELNPTEGSIFNTGALISETASGQVDRTEFNSLLMEKGVMTGTGFNINIIRKNLKKENTLK